MMHVRLRSIYHILDYWTRVLLVDQNLEKGYIKNTIYQLRCRKYSKKSTFGYF